MHCNETSTTAKGAKYSSNTTTIAGLAVTLLFIALLLYYFCFYKQPTYSNGASKAHSTLASVSPADLSNNDYSKSNEEIDRAEFMHIADTMKNVPQTYTKEEKGLLAKGEMFYLASIDKNIKSKEVKVNEGQITIKRMHIGKETAETGMATAVVDAGLEECAAYEFHSTFSNWWKNAAKEHGGITDLQTKKINPHCLYYFTCRDFGIPGISSRQNRCRIIWEKKANGTIVIDASDTDDFLNEFPLNPSLARARIHTCWTYEPLEPIGDIQQTAVTLISKVDFGGLIPTSIVNKVGYTFFSEALIRTMKHFDKSLEIQAYKNDATKSAGKISR